MGLKLIRENVPPCDGPGLLDLRTGAFNPESDFPLLNTKQFPYL